LQARLQKLAARILLVPLHGCSILSRHLRPKQLSSNYCAQHFFCTKGRHEAKSTVGTSKVKKPKGL
jgi:hypothetical protein